MASFVLSFFPLDVLDEIWDLIESVSEGSLTYSLIHYFYQTHRGYLLFGGEYQIYFIEWDENLSKFTSA